MRIEEFAEKVCSVMEKELGDGYRVERKDVRKNNGILLHGLMVLERGSNVAPTIYLDAFFEEYESGLSIDGITCRLLDIFRKDKVKGNIDMDFFRSFEKVKDRICYRLVGREGNEKLLEDMPYIEFLDLAICFYYAYQGGALGDGTISIHNSHMELWDTSTEELYKLAERNTRRLFPWICQSLAEVLKEIGIGGEELMKDVPMKVLSNEKRIYGAVCMFYQDVLDGIARDAGHDLYILPSSVHEVILLPDTGGVSPEELKKMIREVNSTQVALQEVLSYSLYHYGRAEKEIMVV